MSADRRRLHLPDLKVCGFAWQHETQSRQRHHHIGDIHRRHLGLSCRVGSVGPPGRRRRHRQ